MMYLHKYRIVCLANGTHRVTNIMNKLYRECEDDDILLCCFSWLYEDLYNYLARRVAVFL